MSVDGIGWQGEEEWEMRGKEEERIGHRRERFSGRIEQVHVHALRTELAAAAVDSCEA